MSRSHIMDEFTNPTATVISKGFTIQDAYFTCGDSESMRIEGTVIGDIDIDGVIIIGDSGYVDGNVRASSVRIAGRVYGNVQCRHALHLTSTADIVGDINAPSLIIDNGAVLVGYCQAGVIAESEQVKLSCS